MTSQHEKLAESLKLLKTLQEKGQTVFKSKEIMRSHRERLIKNNFLLPVIKGWYCISHPREMQGDSTSWYASFWAFVGIYLKERFSDIWCLSPEQSLLLHAENYTIPKQLFVRSPIANNKNTNLIFKTSILDVKLSIPDSDEIVVKNSLNLYSLESALISVPETFYHTYPIEAQTNLNAINDASQLLSSLLKNGQSVVAGRLSAAFHHINKNKIAKDIKNSMKAAGYTIREKNPFQNKPLMMQLDNFRSPYVNRIKLMWQSMSNQIDKSFTPIPMKKKSIKEILTQITESYKTDAYHSLSIEGYRVNEELIEKVQKGKWNPEKNITDKEHLNALAARGYWQAFQIVKENLKKVVKSRNPGDIAEEEHGNWYLELFSPGVQAGILKASDLAGYRNNSVYIRNTRHVPPRPTAVRDSMPELFNLIKNEIQPDVKIILSHFIFVFIHPYFDGNGRMGRFLMNFMLVAAGYPWTIIPVSKRSAYMKALDKASIEGDILPFTKLISDLVKKTIEGKPEATLPDTSAKG